MLEQYSCYGYIGNLILENVIEFIKIFCLIGLGYCLRLFKEIKQKYLGDKDKD